MVLQTAMFFSSSRKAVERERGEEGQSFANSREDEQCKKRLHFKVRGGTSPNSLCLPPSDSWPD